ncbi:MAG: ABC transporter ATP-binding protein [Syntrophomonas sp.]|nr:ABC transporter ATP-binding protein [Syntrophomonas sp.]
MGIITAKISIRSASFSYGKKEVWRDINLEIDKGETICLLGPNGCGKTTLLNCIHGDTPLNSGEIYIDGQNVKSMGVTELARLMGYVFQEHSAPFPFTSLEVVRMGRSPHLGLFQVPSRQDTERARNILEEMGIGHLANKRYTNISGGERQLVLIARTLCQGTEMILFDEPTSHLDFKNQAIVLQTINKLSNKGLTIIMTSHFPNHAWLLSSRVAMMGYKGFVDIGPAEKVMTEENLSETYGLKVKVYQGMDESNTIKFCTPELIMPTEKYDTGA